MSQQFQSQQGQQGQPKVTYDLIQRELAKAVWKNENLRSEIARDPKGTIERALGVHFPQNLNVKVIDQAEDSVYFVLPHHPNDVYGFELTSDQLDQVAGGAVNWGAIATGIGMGAAALGQLGTVATGIAGAAVGGEKGQQIAQYGQLAGGALAGMGQMGAQFGMGMMQPGQVRR